MLCPPRKLHRFVKVLCERLVPSTNPVRVPVVPRPGGEFDNCFFEVQKTIQQRGGTVEHGWCIWELPGLFIEGEFHGVWISPAGERVDVTPKIHGENEILFLPDPKETFDERSPTIRDNVRQAILDDPAVHEFIRHNEAFARFRNEGTDPAKPRLFVVNADQYKWFNARKRELELRMIAIRPGRNDMCRCGSSEKFKRCCGK